MYVYICKNVRYENSVISKALGVGVGGGRPGEKKAMK